MAAGVYHVPNLRVAGPGALRGARAALHCDSAPARRPRAPRDTRVRPCTASLQGSRRLQQRPVHDVPNGRSTGHRASNRPHTAGFHPTKERESPPRTEAPDGSPTDTLRASRPSASVMGRSQWPVCRGVTAGVGSRGRCQSARGDPHASSGSSGGFDRAASPASSRDTHRGLEPPGARPL